MRRVIGGRKEGKKKRKNEAKKKKKKREPYLVLQGFLLLRGSVI